MIFKKCLCLVFSASVMYYVSNTVICLYLIFWYWSGRGWLFIKQEQHPLTWISSACSSAPAKCLASLKTTSSTSLKQVRHIRMLVCMHTCVCVLHVWSLCVVESEGPCPSHMIVMCRGRVFTFDALCDGRILTPPELLRYWFSVFVYPV